MTQIGFRQTWLGLSVVSCLVTCPVQAESIKIAFIDPLSGPGAAIGEGGLKHFRYAAGQVNLHGGANGKTFEIVPFDNKNNPQEGLVAAQKAIDDGVRFIVQANSSAVGLALSDFVLKHNKRNPEREVLYLNYSANDPVLTNEKCHFWHFRFDANTDIKMAALTNYVKAQSGIKKVYLLNQDYSFGQSFRAQARTMLTEKRPDIEIVGDELHPFLKVTDFSPYAAKIKASGADTILTGNWGQDLALPLKAAAEAGLQANWYTYYAGGIGAPTAIRQANLPDRVFEIIEEIPNSAPAEFQAYETDFRVRNGGMSIWLPRVVNQLRMLATAISEAKSENVRKVAEKLEGMKFPGVSGGEVWMRKEDHQAFQPIYVGSFGPLKAGEKFDEEGTGWGWRQVGAVDGKDTVLPTICKMERPQ
jgi:branched-chain amino acid transport system substrate-binding protein